MIYKFVDREVINMNYNVENVIITYSIITGINDRKKIIETLKKSITFRSLVNGSPALLYEGYTSNFFDIIDELKAMKNCPEEVMKITHEMVNISNRARHKKYAHKKIQFRLPLRLRVMLLRRKRWERTK
jgi:hypothetical protein